MATIKLVYQDCPLCGSREGWGAEQLKVAEGASIEIEKLSFASPEGTHLCHEAVMAGIGHLPFFTDGKRFSHELSDFVPKKKGNKK